MDWKWDEFYSKSADWLIVHVPKILLAIIVLVIGLWLARVAIRMLKRTFERRKFNASLRYFLENFIAITFQVLVIFIALQIAGIELTFFAAIVAGLSVAAGLALSGTLQNFVSGVLILFLHPYRVGDSIVVQSQTGIVTSIQLFYTTILTFDNKTIIVPNGQLSNNVVVNLSREGNRRIDFELKFPFKVDYHRVKQIISDLVISTQNILESPVARIGVTNLEADKYTIVVQVWTAAHGFEDARLLFQEKILETLKAEGIFA
ncbi:MAG: mechanosensitive ion channel family protein [Chitinophagaceae bacterium]|nr:mechanosensitive ion channel family protein [Chitinophagaceae bacterium]